MCFFPTSGAGTTGQSQTDKFRSLPQIIHKSDVKIDYRALGQIILKV